MNLELLQWLASVKGDPLGFVLGAFPWGEPGTVLEKFDGPDDWQRSLLQDIADGLLSPSEAIQLATASGHGIGKSCVVAWIILWAFMTFPDTRGTVTANTETQLKTKTWAELGKWFNLCFFAREHFKLEATALLSKDPTRERTWRIDMIPWSEKNPAAFAGMHNQGKRILLIMDEASEIADVIWETAEGALTDEDTEILWLVFGNPTKATGRFRECFEGGLHHAHWKCRQIDSRSVKITNKSRLDKWIQTYGLDSDFTRIRVLGQFPKHGFMEFFSRAEIEAAMARDDVTVSKSDPFALGVDVARYGKNNSVLFFRKGRDARSFPREIYNGLSTVELAQKVFNAYTNFRPDGIFIDEGGVGGGVVDNCRQAHHLFVYGVQFGGKDDVGGIPWGNPGEHYANKRAAIYGAARAWIKSGALPNDQDLLRAFMAIKYTFDKKDQILLVPKEDILEENPDIPLDDLDAFCLTFAYPIAAHDYAGGPHQSGPPVADHDYDPFSEQRMTA